MQFTLTRPRAAHLSAALLALALIVAGCGDGETVTEAAAGSTGADDESSEGSGHDHAEVIEMPDGMAVPQVAITAEPDPVSGVNLFVDIDEFEIAPEHASSDPVDGEGHLHLYVDGVRVLRFYNTALHIAGLDPGDHEIAVEVSANNHAAYALDGEPIRAVETISVDGTEHGHSETKTVAASTPPPDVTLGVTEDPKSGWNIHVETTNFEFAPQSSGADHVDGEGHLHLYVDGVKITRLYGPWWHLAELAEGSHELRVEVSTNDHSVYTVDEEPIVATVIVDVTAEQATAESGTTDHDTDDALDEMDDGAIAEESDLVIRASIADGSVDIADERVEIEAGSSVTIVVEADTADVVHLHGYDLLADVSPTGPAEIVFTADVPGVFEVELEGAGTFLFEIVVR